MLNIILKSYFKKICLGKQMNFLFETLLLGIKNEDIFISLHK